MARCLLLDHPSSFDLPTPLRRRSRPTGALAPAVLLLSSLDLPAPLRRRSSSSRLPTYRRRCAGGPSPLVLRPTGAVAPAVPLLSSPDLPAPLRRRSFPPSRDPPTPSRRRPSLVPSVFRCIRTDDLSVLRCLAPTTSPQSFPPPTRHHLQVSLTSPVAQAQGGRRWQQHSGGSSSNQWQQQQPVAAAAAAVAQQCMTAACIAHACVRTAPVARKARAHCARVCVLLRGRWRQPEASQRPARGQPEASQRPARGQPEASQRPARGQPEASQRPARGPGCAPTEAPSNSNSGYSVVAWSSSAWQLHAVHMHACVLHPLRVMRPLCALVCALLLLGRAHGRRRSGAEGRSMRTRRPAPAAPRFETHERCQRPKGKTTNDPSSACSAPATPGGGHACGPEPPSARQRRRAGGTSPCDQGAPIHTRWPIAAVPPPLIYF